LTTYNDWNVHLGQELCGLYSLSKPAFSYSKFFTPEELKAVIIPEANQRHKVGDVAANNLLGSLYDRLELLI